MAIPPQYSAPSEKKKPNITLIVVLSLAALVVCLCLPVGAAILFPVFAEAKLAAKVSANSNQTIQLCNSLLMYASDHDDRLPPADRWMDAADTWIGNPELLKSELNENVGFAMNDGVSGASLGAIPAPEIVPMIFNTAGQERNAHGGIEKLFVKENGPKRLKAAIGFCSGSIENQPTDPTQYDWNPKLDKK